MDIHLNPVRAGIVSVADLRSHRFSSCWYLHHPHQRPRFLRVEAALVTAGDLPDTAKGRDCYADYLAWQAAEGPAGRNAAYVAMSRGWAIGSEEFKLELLQDPLVATEARAWADDGTEEVRNLRWRAALVAALSYVPPEGRQPRHKSAPWKRAIATHLRETTDVSNQWLAWQLEMGSAAYVSKHVGLTQRNLGGTTGQLLQHLRKVKGEA